MERKSESPFMKCHFGMLHWKRIGEKEVRGTERAEINILGFERPINSIGSPQDDQQVGRIPGSRLITKSYVLTYSRLKEIV